jgi:ornithine carbamoyltransferase
MTLNLKGRSLLRETDLTREQFIGLLDLADELKAAKKAGEEVQRLRGKNVALIFEKASTRTRCALEVAAYDQGAHVTYLSDGTQIGVKESIKDTARVLGRMYDAISYRGYLQSTVDTLAKYSGVPVYNALTDDFHPMQLLADMMTMREHSPKPLNEVSYAFLGDARFNMGNSLLITGAMLGMDVRIVAPQSLWPRKELMAEAMNLAEETGARITITEDVAQGVRGVDFVHTDVWVSMGEADSAWQTRIKELLPYQVNASAISKVGNADVKFMHCLPSFHNRETKKGEEIFQRFGVDGMEVNEDVFESENSIVFDQTENRLHTMKAIFVATLI